MLGGPNSAEPRKPGCKPRADASCERFSSGSLIAHARADTCAKKFLAPCAGRGAERSPITNWPAARPETGHRSTRRPRRARGVVRAREREQAAGRVASRLVAKPNRAASFKSPPTGRFARAMRRAREAAEYEACYAAKRA